MCVCNVGTLHTCIPLRKAPDTLPTIKMIKRGPNELFFHAADQGKTWRLWTWRLLPVSIGQLEASCLKANSKRILDDEGGWPNISRKWSDNKKATHPNGVFFPFFFEGNSGLGSLYLKPETHKSHLKTDALEDWEFPFGDFLTFRGELLNFQYILYPIGSMGLVSLPFPIPIHYIYHRNQPCSYMHHHTWILWVWEKNNGCWRYHMFLMNDFFYPKMMVSKVGISYSRVPFLGSMLNKNEGTWQFFVTFLGWLSDPFTGYVTSKLGDKRALWITWYSCVFSSIWNTKSHRKKYHVRLHQEQLSDVIIGNTARL